MRGYGLCGPGALIVHTLYFDLYSQNCVWKVPRCSGRTERRGFVTGLVPDLWSVMKYRLYKYIYICILYICILYICILYTYIYTCNVNHIHHKDMHVEATHAGC